MSKLSNVVTNEVVRKTKYNKLVTKVDNIDTSDFVLKTKYNTYETELENKIPSIITLVKKTDYNTKITEIENKYIDASEFNTLATNFFNVRLAQANLITKTNFDAKLSNINRKITENESKHLLIESELNKLKTFDSGYFIRKGHFDNEDGTQNYLVFQPLNKYFKLITNTNYVSSWKSKGLSSESIKPPATSDNSLTPALNYYGTKTRVKFTLVV